MRTARFAFAALGVAMLVWFFAGRDARGPSARVSADGWYYHCYLVSLFRDGDLDFANEYAFTGNWYHFGRTAAGRPANPFGIGPALYEAPLYLAGGAIARVAGREGNGFGSLQAIVTMLAAPLFSLGGVFFAYRLLRRRLPGVHPALWGAIAAFAAGPMLYYAVRQPGYAHPFATFFTSWLLDFWDSASDRPRSLRTWLALGALAGAAALARPQLALWAIVLVPTAIADRRKPHWLLAGAAAALAAFAPQLLAWRSIYGAWWIVPQGSGFMVWEAPRWSEVLFSARNGLLAWSPLYALALVGLALGVRKQRRLAGWLLAGVALQVWANGAVWDWWAGGSFGGRRFDSCLVPMALGLGLLFAARRAVAWTAGAVAALCVAANVALAGRSNVFLMPGHWAPKGAPAVYVPAPVVDGLRHHVPPGLADAVGGLSWLATLPARAAFALAHGAPLGAYDRVVGVHFLTEQYPGTGGAVKNAERVPLTGHEPWLIGFTPAPGGALMRGDRARILVSLNRRHGPVLLGLRASGPVSLRWDGEPVADGRTLSKLERGVHDLDVSAAQGTVITELSLDLPPGAEP